MDESEADWCCEGTGKSMHSKPLFTTFWKHVNIHVTSLHTNKNNPRPQGSGGSVEHVVSLTLLSMLRGANNLLTI